MSDEFSKYFEIRAKKPNGRTRKISSSERHYRVQGGKIKILGIADLRQGKEAENEFTYSEDHDNQLDIIIKASSRRAAASLKQVILPDPRLGTHSPIYTPGGPGSGPSIATTFTESNGGQILNIKKAINSPYTVSWASQSLDDYDMSDRFAVAFRLRDKITGSTLLTASSIDANDAIDNGFELVDVPFSVNSRDSFSKDICELSHPQTQDRF